MDKFFKTHTLFGIIVVLLLGVVVVAGVRNFSSVNTAPKKAAPTIIDDTPVTKKVFLLIFNPIIESQGGKKLSVLKNWYDPDALTNQLISGFPGVTNNYLSYTIVERQEVDGIFPKPDGFVYTDESYLTCNADASTCHKPDIIDYQKLYTDYNICSKNVDEVWLWGGGYFGFWEYNPVTYCGKTQFVMGFNYERSIAEAWHDFGHRMEYVGSHRVGDPNWNYSMDFQNEANPWNAFSMLAGHCGNVHYPPGTTRGGTEFYYNNPSPVSTDCDKYLTYPVGISTPKTVTCTEWDCSQEGFMRWWLTRIPHNPGIATFNGVQIYANWWKYFAFYDDTVPLPPTPTFSFLSATLPFSGPASFYFSYSDPGSAGGYTVDLSTTQDMSSDVYLTFAVGSTSPVTETNPIKWDKYSCGRTLYWRVKTTSGVQSPIQPSAVTCVTPTAILTPTATNTPIPTPTPTTPSWITLIQPNGGEVLYAGQPYTITWDSSSDLSRVRISYIASTGIMDWIAYDIPNTKSYRWIVNVGNTANTQFKIKVDGYTPGSPSKADQSDNYFSVLPVPTATLTPTSTNTPTPTSTQTPTPTPTPSPSPTPTPTPTPTHTPTPTPIPTNTPTPLPPTFTPTPTIAACLLGDINRDGVVNSVDRSLLLAKFFLNSYAEDLNRDGIVDVADYSLLVTQYGKSTGPCR